MGITPQPEGTTKELVVDEIPLDVVLDGAIVEILLLVTELDVGLLEMSLEALLVTKLDVILFDFVYDLVFVDLV